MPISLPAPLDELVNFVRNRPHLTSVSGCEEAIKETPGEHSVLAETVRTYTSCLIKLLRFSFQHPPTPTWCHLKEDRDVDLG